MRFLSLMTAAILLSSCRHDNFPEEPSSAETGYVQVQSDPESGSESEKSAPESGRPAPSLAGAVRAGAEVLLSMMPGAGVAMPDTLNPGSAAGVIRKKSAEDDRAARGRGDRWVNIPKERWIEMMPDRSPAPICDYPKKGGSGYLNADPLNGARTGSDWFEGPDIVRSPFKVRSRATGEWIYERAGDMPADTAYPIKGYDEFMHYDGTARKLAYIESSGLVFGGRPMKVYPANIVWNERLGAIVGMWGGGVIPDLMEAYLATGDEKYAGHLIMILERLAEIYPNMPLAFYNGLSDYSRDDLIRMAKNHEPVGDHGWLGPSRLTAAATNFRPPSEGHKAWILARAFMAVERSASWGDTPAEADARRLKVRTGLLEELSLLFHSYGAYNCVANGIGMYAPGLLGLGVACRDRYLFDGFNAILEEFLYNENYYDGISTEGSLNYAGMVGGMWKLWGERGGYDPGYLEKHPFLTVCGRSQQRISSLWGIQSQHGDGPNMAFMISKDGPRKDADGREAQEPSRVFGGYGITLLRAGARGRRLEIFLHHDRAVGHAHDDMLGVQLHYRGLPLTAFIGDARWGRFLNLDPKKNRFADKIGALKYPRPMVESEPSEYVGFAHGLNSSPLTKNTAIVDENGTGRKLAPWRGGFGAPKEPFGNLRVIKTASDPDGPAARFQVAEATGENMLPMHYQGIRAYRRTIIAVTRPDGRPYAVDVFHVAGGNRRLMLWNSRGDVVDMSFDRRADTTADLERWFADTFKDARGEWSAPTVALDSLHYVKNVAAKKERVAKWRCVWRLDYLDWMPKTATDRAAYEALGVGPVLFGLHGVFMPHETAAYSLRATSIFPAIIDETIDGKRQRGMVRFRDGLQYAGVLAEDPNTRSTSNFVHVIEPWSDGEEPFVKSLEALPPAAGERMLPSGAAAVRIAFADGTTDIVALLPPGGGEYTFGNGLCLRGRFALVRLDEKNDVSAARIVSGTKLAYRGRTLVEKPFADFRGRLVDVRGDLSGDRSESALIVETDCVWPEGATLAGRYATLVCNRGRRFENYEIARVERLAADRVKIVLRDFPPFIDFFGKVKRIGASQDPPERLLLANEFIAEFCCKGSAFATSPYLVGSRVAFPTHGLEFGLRDLESRPGRYTLDAEVDLGEIGIAAGTPFAIYPDLTDAFVRVAGEAGFATGPDGEKTIVGE